MRETVTRRKGRYPAAHDQLDAIPRELLCGINSNLAIIRAQHMVMRVHQPHLHNVLQASHAHTRYIVTKHL